MRKIHQINIKNQTYYFYNDQINLKNFDTRLLKVDQKYYKEIGIYYIGYVTVKNIANCNNINPIQDGEGGQKGPPTSFFPVTFTNV